MSIQPTDFSAHARAIGLVLLLGLPCTVRAEDAFPDDHADTYAGATPLAVGVPDSGVIEIDVERDTFRFTTEKNKQMSVTVTPIGLWDATVRLRSSDGTYLIDEANSVGASQAVLQFAHPAGPLTAYVEVEGFARWTEGTYDIVVSSTSIADTDTDMLPDIWEMQEFGDLDSNGGGDEDGDGESNHDEYRSGTDPNSAASRLRITGMVSQPSYKVITWSSAPLRDYAVSIVPTLDSTNWIALGVATGVTETASFTDSGSGAADERFYRIEVCE